MSTKIKTFIAAAILALAFVITPAVALAASQPSDAVCTKGTNTTTVGDSISAGANAAATGQAASNCTSETNVGTSDVGKLGNRIVNLFSLIIGIVAIIMIIYGGFRYITSGGSSERVGAAKNTIIYALIGLVIAALAQVIVHFVLHQSNCAVDPNSGTCQT